MNDVPDGRFDFLSSLYAGLATVVRRAGRTYPAAIAMGEGTPSDLVTVAAKPAWVDPRLRAAGERHLQDVARRSPKMHDGRVLACVTMKEGLPMTCAAGGYFDAIATSDSLRAEYVQQSGCGLLATGLASLPLRELAHEAAGTDALRCGRGRVAAVGVSVAVTLPFQSRRALLLGQRSNELATDPALWHIAPSGMLEPSRGDPVTDVAARELSEELGVRLAAEGELRSRLKPLGVGFDLLRLRPEICLQLDLGEDEYPKGGPFLSTREFQDRRLLELSGASMQAFWQRHPPEALTPAAAAAIALLEDAESLGSDGA